MGYKNVPRILSILAQSQCFCTAVVYLIFERTPQSLMTEPWILKNGALNRDFYEKTSNDVTLHNYFGMII